MVSVSYTHLVAAYLDKEKPWVSKMEYNALGQETQRLFSNNICSAWAVSYTHL